MSDEIRRAHDVGNAVRRQMGKIPSGKRKKKKDEDKEVPVWPVDYSQGAGRKDRIGKKIIHEGEEVFEPTKKSKGAIDQGYIDVESWNTPKPVTGGRKKALPRPAPKAIEAPGTGPWIAERLVDLNPGPNFGGDVYSITKAKKPRQFDGY